MTAAATFREVRGGRRVTRERGRRSHQHRRRVGRIGRRLLNRRTELCIAGKPGACSPSIGSGGAGSALATGVTLQQQGCRRAATRPALQLFVDDMTLPIVVVVVGAVRRSRQRGQRHHQPVRGPRPAPRPEPVPRLPVPRRTAGAAAAARGAAAGAVAAVGSRPASGRSGWQQRGQGTSGPTSAVSAARSPVRLPWRDRVSGARPPGAAAGGCGSGQRSAGAVRGAA